MIITVKLDEFRQSIENHKDFVRFIDATNELTENVKGLETCEGFLNGNPVVIRRE